MAERPKPVAICSTLTTHGAQTTMQALAAGAFAIVSKPLLGVKEFLDLRQSRVAGDGPNANAHPCRTSG